MPLVFRHGVAEVALVLVGIALACDDGWSLVAVTGLGGLGQAAYPRRGTAADPGARRRDEHFAAGRQRLVPEVW